MLLMFWGALVLITDIVQGINKLVVGDYGRVTTNDMFHARDEEQ